MMTACSLFVRFIHILPCRRKTPGKARVLHEGWPQVPSLVVIVVALTTVPTTAQVQLPEIRVTATEGSAGGSLELERKSSTGSRLDLKLQEQPAAVEIIPGEVIRERGDVTTQEAVTRATGITASGTPGNGSSSLVSRGFAGHSSVMQLYDGTRFYVGAGTVTFPVDTWLLDRVEVIRGPSSVLYGEGAIGGAVNYIPRQPMRRQRVTDVLLSGGSFETYQVGVNSTGPISNRMAYQVGLIGTTSEGYVDRGEWHRLSLASSLLFEVTPDLTLSLAFDGSFNEPDEYWGTPLNDGKVDERLRERNYNVNDSRIRYQDYWVRLRADWRVAPAVTLHNETYFLMTDRHWRNLEEYEYLPDTQEVFRTSYLEIFHDQQQFGNRLDARVDGTVLGLPYRFLVGFDVNRINFRHTNNSPYEGESTVDALHPDPGRFINVAGTEPKYETHTNQFSVFTEGLLSVIERFKIVAGLRLDYIDYSREDLITSDNSFDRTFDSLTWRVGGVFDITDDITAYAQVTRGADPLGSIITLSLSQEDTKLTTAMQYEIGVKSRFLEGRGEATLAGYYIAKKNLLSRDPNDPNETQQVGEQIAYGFEAALGIRPVDSVEIDANLAVLEAKFEDFNEVSNDVAVSRDGNQPPNVPELIANLWAVYTPTPVWRFGAGLRYVGKRFADNANTIRIPSYTLLDAFLTYTPAPLWNVTLRGRNLTDETYTIASYGSTQFILGEPRAVELAVSLRF